jgi:hypothetical protein
MYTPEEVEDWPPLPKPEREVVGERIDKPTVGRIQLEGEIDQATTLKALEALVPLIQELPPEDQNALRSRYATQKHLIKSKPAAEPATDNWGDLIGDEAT